MSEATEQPDVIVSYGWCAPSGPILDNLTGRGPIDPETEHHYRPCDGEHRWERMVSRPQCGCGLCDYTERYVECAGCVAVVREAESGFEELWETAPWG